MTGDTASSRDEQRIRSTVQRAGDEIVDRLIAEHIVQFVDANTACLILGVSNAELRQKMDRGEIIGYIAPGSATPLCPRNQFRRNRVADWVPHVIAAVGNGSAAIHLLYVRRGCFGGNNLMELIGKDELDGTKALYRTLIRLVADAPHGEYDGRERR